MHRRVSELVASQPAVVLDDPDAAGLLVTPANVTASHPSLRYLLLWCPAHLPVVVNMLSRCRPDGNLKAPLSSHPLVAAYVARCLRCFDVANLSFILPQLVQALRHDVHGHMTEVLLELSGQSVLLSHQLLWVLNSESAPGAEETKGPGGAHAAAAPTAPSGTKAPKGVAEGSGGSAEGGSSGPGAHFGFQGHLPGVDPLPEATVGLRDRVVHSMSQVGRRVFDAEYNFFDRLTAVSGRLKKEVHDKDQRRAKVLPPSNTHR